MNKLFCFVFSYACLLNQCMNECTCRLQEISLSVCLYILCVCVFGSLYDECGGGDWICPTKGNRNTSPKKLAKNSGTIDGRTAPPDLADHLLRQSYRYTLHGGDHQTIPDCCQSPADQLPPHQLRWQEPLYVTATDPPTPAWANTPETGQLNQSLHFIRYTLALF